MRSSSSISMVIAALLASPTLAFRDTSPFLLWNTDPSRISESASKSLYGSALKPAEEVYNGLSNLGCDWDNLVVVHKDGLHSSQLNKLDYPTHDAHLHIPYLSRPQKRGLDTGLEIWAESCDATIVSSFDDRVEGKKNVILIESAQGESIPSIPSNLNSYILILTGSPVSNEKRQERPFPTHITHSASATTTLQATSTSTTTDSPRRNSTIPSKDVPLLDRVQLLTTPIITSLLIVFLILLPILGFGISMLTSIQVPPKMMEISKSLAVGKDRKDQ